MRNLRSNSRLNSWIFSNQYASICSPVCYISNPFANRCYGKQKDSEITREALKILKLLIGSIFIAKKHCQNQSGFYRKKKKRSILRLYEINFKVAFGRQISPRLPLHCMLKRSYTSGSMPYRASISAL